MPTKRKWFDLKTTKGWIEAAGALVAVLGGAIGFYLQVFPKEPDKQPTAAIAFNVPMNVQGSGTKMSLVRSTSRSINQPSATRSSNMSKV